MASVTTTVRKKSPYELQFTTGLPPGTDTPGHLQNPRPPRLDPKPKRPAPEWPSPEKREGRWVTKYLDQLDPETEFDQIIRTASLFSGSDFSTALGYTANFVCLTATPAGSFAIHGGKVTTRGHQRYYETTLFILDWIFHGSLSTECRDSVNKVNKIHEVIWKRKPGTYSAPWEGQMALIGLSFFETHIRRLVGTRKQDIHPKVKAAYPYWGEKIASYFITEPGDGSRTMDINYPRTWEEMEEFFYWYIDFPFNEQRSPELQQKGHETALAFVDQFAEFWFPRQLKFVGRSVLLTFVPEKIRIAQRMPTPNPIVTFFVKLGLKILLDLQDWMADPVEPPVAAFREMLVNLNMYSVDKKIKTLRDSQDRVFMIVSSFIVLGLLILLERAARLNGLF